MQEATIMKIVSNQYTIRLDDGMQIPAVAMGKLRKQNAPVVGDRVRFEWLEGKACMQQVLPRKNELVRPLIANVDQAVIVMSIKEPDFSYALVDRLIFLIAYQNIEPVLVLTKLDLDPERTMIEPIVQEYRFSGYTVVPVEPNEPAETWQRLFQGKVSVLTGQSGVGKSSLLNRLDPQFCLQTQAISKALGRGKHTTRHVELYPLAGGWVADTPGFSSLDFSRIKAVDLKERIPDFQIGGECRFRDCTHTKEPGCRIRKAVEAGTISRLRYEHYLQVIPLCDQRKEWEL